MRPSQWTDSVIRHMGNLIGMDQFIGQIIVNILFVGFSVHVSVPDGIHAAHTGMFMEWEDVLE